MKQRQHIDALPSVREADGMQALHFAAESASVDCFRVLLGAGANPVATDKHSTREQHSLRSSSRPHLQSQSGAKSTEVDTLDAEIPPAAAPLIPCHRMVKFPSAS